MDFFDRKEELKRIKEIYDTLETGEFVVIYGRRRVGKTAFIKRFLETIKAEHIYYMVQKTGKKELLELPADSIFDQTGDKVQFFDWKDMLSYLVEKSKSEKIVMIFDEFSRFQEIAPEFITQLQDYWDSTLKKNKILLIAIGSSMSMMHQIFMQNTAPLYGRITYTIHMDPFRYADFRTMFPELNEKEKIALFSVFGGTPHFLWFVKKTKKKDVFAILETLVLHPTGRLKDEPTNFITMELKKDAKYNALLYAIAKSNGERKEVIHKSGIQSKDIDYYVNNLEELLSIVEKVIPMFQKRKEVRYMIKDNYFHFWYKFIFPNSSIIELGNIALVKEKIKNDLNAYIGQRFEGIMKELLILYNTKKIKDLDINFTAIGPWWGKNREGIVEEIEIVANNAQTKDIILCEVKWTNKPIGTTEVKKLDAKVKYINASGTFHYLLVSTSGFTEECIQYMKEKKVTYLTLDDITALFNNA